MPLNSLPRSAFAWLVAAVVFGMATVLAGCASGSATPASQVSTVAADRQFSRAQALAAAVGMPSADTHEVRDLSWIDAARQREVLARVYLPSVGSSPDQAVPLVVFSHGIGGSREGYSYIGRYLAANGIAALHVQHVGSDRSLWAGNPVQMLGRLQEAAKEGEAVDRTKDVSFALDQVLADAQLKHRFDARRIAAAGHSYGANTTMLLAGARVQRAGAVLW